ncbi:putative disease resistance protein At3g14460 isoform X1 [Quercus robur]|uniref:putative disease resistance protein At3g14460 isoform X1 n=1 Tax=Quercus robur TaxID=38942 RepID=UPI0021619C8C|nr:putative disease resistance protein At3g14460 isoform X1 [Quercus robur]XP_050285886.1 putative disease resistance protein At3g14460 isoform X1 [Quercus robur]XP_050285887.1 putative disease resistance protein At3g14460 isoform X1 [Quercus robur]XP_050285888.1 putative disease resistance protein At3g14460 isoform X1 [Quercus robur]XP_050285889.1 putative disease resistance protein At3g14460 isoform X1 [Quercus robur]XP_050285890.1 putative disease resistance protein At3g14460 isoform X1 [Qu
MLCNLCNLQTLDISCCVKIRKLPQGMGKLIKLRHLLIDDCYGLSEPFPKGIGRLRSLRTLEKFIIGGINNVGECKLGEFKNLVHLKGSLEIGGLENVTDVQEADNAQLKNKIHLRKLRLRFGGRFGRVDNRRGENDELVLNALEPHPELESLWIYGYGGTGYPNWLISLTILKELELDSCDNLEQLPPLGKLRFLESLSIRASFSVKKVGVEFLGIESNRKKDEEMGSTSTSSLILFPNLKFLQFEDMKEWEEWDGIGGTMREEEAQESGVTITIMPRLQNLKIFNCPKLKSLPDFLPTTPLKTLEIWLSPILGECCQTLTEIGDQWPKISHVPNISSCK